VSAEGSLFGYRLRSELPVDRLRPPGGGRGTIEVHRAAEPLEAGAGPELGRLEDSDGSPLFIVSEAGDDLVVWCARAGRFHIRPDDGVITTDSPVGSAAWQDRVTNAIVPLLLGARGELVLHAAALSDGDRAFLFCGTSGRGKSTLADSLARQGAGVVAEDGVALTMDGDRVLAWPGPVGVRLRAGDGDPGKALRVTGTSGTDPEPVAVGGLAMLAPRGGSAPEVQPLAVAEALAPAFSHTIGGRPSRRQGVFSQMAALLARVPAYSVQLPDDLEALDDAAAVVWARMRA
jgi:hypothetical protein